MVKPLGKLTLSAGIARINVGPEETPFDVHVELLCDNSPYFNNVYKDRTDSAICDIPISLPDVDPDVFAKIISWMYRGQLSADLYDVTKLVSLFELWVLAEKLEIPALQDETITACKSRVDSCPPNTSVSTRTIEYVYANTKPGSPPRRLLVDIWVWHWPWQKFSSRKADLPREFLEDLYEVIFARVDVNFPWGQSPLPKLAKEYYVGWTPPAPDPMGFPAPASPPSQDSNVLQVPTRAQMAMRKIQSPSPQLNESSRETPGQPEADGSAAVEVDGKMADSAPTAPNQDPWKKGGGPEAGL